ncbi:hypothetical protein KCP77_08240 [Salmonella enterica subsp. enterica]|nr:hypothetical protein KCP77_08240 [Salmonella enterica subsp. enterica]
MSGGCRHFIATSAAENRPRRPSVARKRFRCVVLSENTSATKAMGHCGGGQIEILLRILFERGDRRNAKLIARSMSS